MIPTKAEMLAKIGSTEIEKITNRLVAAIKFEFEMELASSFSSSSWYGIERRICVENIEILNQIISNFKYAGYEVTVKEQSSYDKELYPNYYTIVIK